jgi:3-hydroxyisobutyrate dehydrogenase-like beta-hydroxyacid dehydrogenase
MSPLVDAACPTTNRSSYGSYSMPSHNDKSSSVTVTVLGLGPMGRALAGAFVDAGLATTVWNRTPGRDRELVERGAVGASTPELAVAASDLIVVCVVDYDAADAILRRDAVADALKGRTVVNLTADTPGRARDLAAWAERHGVAYLDGAIMTPTATIGTDAAVFIYSGPEELHRRHSDALRALGGTHTHLGEDIGRAAAYDLALLDIFWTAMSGYAHALALAKDEGVTARELAPFAQVSPRSSPRSSSRPRHTWTTAHTRGRTTRSPRRRRPCPTSCTRPRPTASMRPSCAPRKARPAASSAWASATTASHASPTSSAAAEAVGTPGRA